MGQHYIYKYVYEDEIIYIGKTDNRPLSCRIKEHAKEPKFKPFLEGCKIYYFETIHQTENGLFESCLIDRYKPRLNVVDNHPEGVGRFNNIEEPEWIEYSSRTYITPPKDKIKYSKVKIEKKYPEFNSSGKSFFPDQNLEQFLIDTRGLNANALQALTILLSHTGNLTEWFSLNEKFYSLLFHDTKHDTKDTNYNKKRLTKKVLIELENNNIVEILTYDDDPVVKLTNKMKKYTTPKFSLDALDLNDPIAKFVFDTLSPAFEDPECQDFIRKLF